MRIKSRSLNIKNLSDILHLKIRHLQFTVYVLLLSFSLFTGQTRSQETDTTVYKTPTIEVDAIRGIIKVVPITLETIKRETIEKGFLMQNLPMFLNGSTNINAYSESGSSIGNSFFTIRGFDQRRISVMINGVPQNDAEEHQVYWNELSDITSSLENIQIQRGMSTALFGASEIGGVINLQTVDYFKNKFISLNAGYGAYNSKRFSFEYSSGLSKGGFGYYGKLSKTNSDGYRNLSWADQWSYFFSAGKLIGQNSVIKLNVYGSPVKNHLTYAGITKDYLDGNVTDNQSTDRRFNPLDYPDETEEFFQPHFELVYNLQATKNLYISNTFNYIRREGNYTKYNSALGGYNFTDFRLKHFYTSDSTTYNPNYYLRNSNGSIFYDPWKGYIVERSDIVVKSITKGNDFGWYPKIHLKHSGDMGNLVIGGELRLHNSENSGEIVYSDALPPGTPANYKYYFYNGKKTTYSVYLNEFTNIEKELSGMIGLQFTYHKYSIDNIAYTPYSFDADYKFFNTRIGMNYNFNEHFRSFLNLSAARREPRLSDIYDGSNVKAAPNFQNIDTVNRTYSQPLIDFEELRDYELGFGYSENTLKASLNFYWMEYKNEIVSNGQLNNFGRPITSNAGESVHRGIELEFEYTLPAKIYSKVSDKNSNFIINGNLTLSDNYFRTYIEKNRIDTLGNLYGNDYSGNHILLTPQIIGNLSLSFNYGNEINAYITMQYIGMQYLDNSENEKKNPETKLVPGYVDKIINPYAVFNAGLSLNIVSFFKGDNLNKYIKSLEASLKLNNIFGTLYETIGGINFQGTPVWIPAAERNIFFNIKAGF
jgi:iron complex outermembrane recepter protein